MTPEFHIGAHVVCIDDNLYSFQYPGIEYANDDLDGLTKGIVYTIRDIFVDPFFDDLTFRLEEIYRQPSIEDYEPGFDARRFRPLRKLTVEDFAVEEEKV